MNSNNIHTKEEVIRRVTSELDDCLQSVNGEVYRWDDKIIDVDLVNQTITIKFDYTYVKEDNYIGLGKY